jgi:hypothetical protein
MRLIGARLGRVSHPRVPTPQLCDDAPIMPPPGSVTVHDDRPVVLYAPDGSPLVRRIGF